jgi:hypothetical protein
MAEHVLRDVARSAMIVRERVGAALARMADIADERAR